MNFDTVAVDTAAARATSRIVAALRRRGVSAASGAGVASLVPMAAATAGGGVGGRGMAGASGETRIVK